VPTVDQFDGYFRRNKRLLLNKSWEGTFVFYIMWFWSKPPFHHKEPNYQLSP